MEELDLEILDRPSTNLECLLAKKQRVQELDNQTNAQLKENIYHNYSLFIESSKEIQSLKMDMYQLNNILKRQQADMSQLLEISITGDNEKFEVTDQVRPRQDESDIKEEFDAKYDEIDVFIAQRNFDEAVDLLLTLRDRYLTDLEPSVVSDLKLKIDNKIQELIDAICSVLQSSTHRGPRFANEPIMLLLKLKRSSLATKLFLNQKSISLKNVIDQQNIDTSANLQCMKRISSIFINTVIDTCNEFRRAFKLDDIVGDYLDNTSTSNALPNNSSPYMECYRQNSLFDHRRPTFACMVSWTRLEFEHFLVTFKKHVFGIQGSPSVIAECVYSLRMQCIKLRDVAGIDLSFHFDRYLEKDIELVIDDCYKKLIVATNKQSSDEVWEYQKFSLSQRDKFLMEMNDVQLENIKNYISEDCRLQFTGAITSFAKLYLITAKDLAKMSNPITESLVSKIVTEEFQKKLESIKAAARSEKALSKKKLMVANYNKFLLAQVWPLAKSNYKKITGRELVEIKSQPLNEVNVSAHH